MHRGDAVDEDNRRLEVVAVGGDAVDLTEIVRIGLDGGMDNEDLADFEVRDVAGLAGGALFDGRRGERILQPPVGRRFQRRLVLRLRGRRRGRVYVFAALPLTVRREVSDHLPLRAEFRVTELEHELDQIINRGRG